MGNVITKYTTNNVKLDESNVSDVMSSQQVAKSPATSEQTRTGLFKNIWNFDPRSPSNFIARTPIAMFRNNSASKFVHQELNESAESQVDLDILTKEEQDSLDSNEDLAKATIDEIPKLPDPRSPVIGSEFIRTPIVLEELKRKKDDNLVKKLADKLLSTAISNDDEKNPDEKLTTKKAKKNKNLIYEDDENVDRYSTPPKKIVATSAVTSSRTPLSCVANTTTPKTRSLISTSTPKSKILIADESQKSVSRIPVSARRLH